jgi:RimJ/RimL family protein N-acetyltransferase
MEIKELTENSLLNTKNKFIDSYLEIWNNKSNLLYLSYTGLKFSKSQVENWILNLKINSNIKYFYVENNSDIVGILVISEDTILGFEIMGIGIRESHKRKGIGTCLLRKGIDVAKDKNYKSIDITVFTDNKSMLCLLLNNDFIVLDMEHGKRYDGTSIIKLKKLV